MASTGSSPDPRFHPFSTIPVGDLQPRWFDVTRERGRQIENQVADEAPGSGSGEKLRGVALLLGRGPEDQSVRRRIQRPEFMSLA
jgi:hypothetical protein